MKRYDITEAWADGYRDSFYMEASKEGAWVDAEIALELLGALEEATDFVDRHSEDWYLAGQRLLSKCRNAIAKAKGLDQ